MKPSFDKFTIIYNIIVIQLNIIQSWRFRNCHVVFAGWRQEQSIKRGEKDINVLIRDGVLYQNKQIGLLFSGRWTPYVINKPSCYFVHECPVDHQWPPLKEDNSSRKSVIFPYNIESLHWDDSIGWMHRCRDNSTRKKNEMVTFFSINKIYASEGERGFPIWLEGVYNMRKVYTRITTKTNELCTQSLFFPKHSNQIHNISVTKYTFLK